MSFFSYNYYKTLERPNVYLAFPNKRIVGTIVARDLETDFMANSMTKGTFKVYRYHDSEETPNYNWIKIGMYVQLSGIDWFIITQLEIINEGLNEYKEITYISLEHELSKKYLTSFGALGVETDEQGGLDRYCLYSITDQAHSIMHIVVQKNPDWSIYYVDPNITKEYRNFQVDSIDTYSFLTKNVSEAFDCIFLFDSTAKTISAYLLENLGKDTNITLSYRNFIKSVEQNSDDDDVKTVLTVVGGNDSRTNTPLDVIDVNISGTNQIYNFSYYLSMMSDKLKQKLKEYDAACEKNREAYQNKLLELGQLYVELNELNNRVPTDPDSTNWKDYGLKELQTQEKKYWKLMSVNTNQYDDVQVDAYNNYKKIHDAVLAEIEVRKSEVSNKEKEVKTCIEEAQNLAIKLETFLGTDLYHELQAYVKEDTLTDDSFVATTEMTDNEILEMRKELLKHAEEELASVCYPKFETTVDLINFTVNYDYKKFTDQLELFNIIHIRLEEHDVITDARLLKLHVNWDDPTDFSATFSNRNSLDEGFALLKEIQDQADGTATEIGFASGAWSGAASTSVEVQEYMNSILDASKQQLVSNSNNEVVIDETGILIRKWIPDQSRYDPCQLWLTNGMLAISVDSWNTVGLAIGYVKMGNDYFFGVCADKLVGNMMISKSLVIANDSGTYTITDDGMLAKNGSYEVKINPNEPDEIFAISIDGNKLLYIDADSKKLKFEGDIESISGHIGGYTIGSKDLTSGGVGMSSDTASNAVAFWAGNSNRNSAAFRVTNTGNLTCSNANITGGTIRIGDRFSVDANGNLVNFQLTAESNRITNEIDRAQKVEAQLRMDVNENAAQILLRVQKDQLISEINTGIDGTGAYIHFKTGSLVIDSTNFKLDRNGNAEFKGSIKSGSTITGSRISASIFESDLFYADDSEIYLGDFGVTDNYGRHIFQSTDEVTGMSTGDVEKGNLYLWAGYGVSPHHTEEAVFLVNTGQVRCGGDLYVQGVNILEAIRDIGGGGGCDCDSYTCDGDACGGGDECGAAYTGGCSSNDPCSSDSCTCDGSYDVPGCQVVSPCTTDS